MKKRLGCLSVSDNCTENREANWESDGDLEIAALQLKALGHPVRLQIIEMLRNQDYRCCGEICSCLPLAQSTISQHLELLCRAGLVSSEPSGSRVHYRLNGASLATLAGRVATMSAPASADETEMETSR